MSFVNDLTASVEWPTGDRFLMLAAGLTPTPLMQDVRCMSGCDCSKMLDIARHHPNLQGDADEDGDNRISEQEFINVLQKPQASVPA